MTIVIISEKGFHDIYHSFSSKGNKVYETTSGESEDVIKQRTPDLVLLDCGSKVENGLRLLKGIKAEHPHLPVIFLTDIGSEDVGLRAFKAGARDFFKIPVNIFEIQETVEGILSVKKAVRESRHPFKGSIHPEELFKNVTTRTPVNIIRSIHYIDENLAEKISLDMIAKTANLSKYHFCRLFFRHTGMTPLKFTTFMRMQRAKELLKREDLTVSIIATQVGFNDLGSFIRQFKKHNGVTPGIYRNSLRKA